MSKAAPGLALGESEKDLWSFVQRKHLLRTKLYVPPVRSSQIARPRLSELMDRGLDRALILVSAPAGYGKTTLVSRWLKEKNIPSAWLSLDGSDNDPIRFMLYLLAALTPIAPGIQDEAFGMLQGAQPAQFESIINLVVNELTSFQDPFVLVLDDFHVIHSEAVQKILAYLLEHLPLPMHLALLTRIDPLLPLSRLRVRNQLLDIRADQLRFTREEIAVFLKNMMGLALSAHDLTALEARTEGWIAGLQLAALSMQGSQDIHRFVSAFTGSHHYVMDYLIEEVLKNQPPKVSAFLLQTCILDRLCEPLCEAVVEADASGSIDGQSMLETLEEMNLFLIPMDEERHWYRYHHLFADVLRKRLETQYSGLLPVLHLRASQWYEQNGFLAESVQQAIAAGNQDRAAQLIEQNGCLLLMSGEVATLLSWTDAIEFQSVARPWLAIQQAWALALTGELERVEPILQAPEKLLALLDATGEVRTLQGTIAAARAYCANSRGDTRVAAQYSRNALDLLPTCSSISLSIRSVATSILGDTSWINGNLDEAVRAYTEAIRIGREAGNPHMVIIATSNIADILLSRGKLHLAADTYSQALTMAVRPDGQRSPLAAKIFSGLGRLAYEWNRLGEAEQNMSQCMLLSRTWGDIGQLALAFAHQARLEQARTSLEQAREALYKAEQFAAEHTLPPRWSIQVESELARLWLAQGNIEKPSQHILKRGLQIEDVIPYRRESEYVLLLRVLLVQGHYDAGIKLSRKLLDLAETTGQMGLVIEVLILQALAFQGRKEVEHALAVLERALILAEPEGYARSFLDEGEAMTRLLCQAKSRQVGSRYAAVLLSGIEKTSGMSQPSMKLLVEPLTAREIEILVLIKSGYSNHDIAGRLVISVPTVKRHISNIYTKLGVRSRTQALAIGKELKIFD